MAIGNLQNLSFWMDRPHDLSSAGMRGSGCSQETFSTWNLKDHFWDPHGLCLLGRHLFGCTDRALSYMHVHPNEGRIFLTISAHLKELL